MAQQQRVKQILSRSAVIRYTRAYAAFYYIGLCWNTRGATGSAVRLFGDANRARKSRNTRYHAASGFRSFAIPHKRHFYSNAFYDYYRVSHPLANTQGHWNVRGSRQGWKNRRYAWPFIARYKCDNHSRSIDVLRGYIEREKFTVYAKWENPVNCSMTYLVRWIENGTIQIHKLKC